MNLDLPTLFFLTGLVFAANLVLSGVLYGLGRRFPGAGLWILGQALLTLGGIFAGLRGPQTPYAFVAVSNILLLGSMLPTVHAAWNFRWGPGFPPWNYLGFAGLGLFFAALPPVSLAWRLAAFSLVAALANGAVFAVLMLKAPARERQGLLLAALPFGLSVPFYLYRFGASLVFEFGENFFASSGWIVWLYPLGLLIACFELFSYFVLASLVQDRRLEERNQALRSLNRSKDLLLSVVAHDLRSPLATAARYVRRRLLEEDPPPERRREILEVLHNSLDRSSSFLEQLLLWTRSLEGGDEAPPDMVRLDEVIEDVLMRAAPQATLKQVALVWQGPSLEVPFELQSLEVILNNLVSNALKFSPAAGVVELRVLPGDQEVRICVTDQGPGVSDEVLLALEEGREPATELGSAGERGNGFGLTLSLAMARRWGGRLHLARRPEGGTETVLVLPQPGTKAVKAERRAAWS